MAADYVGVSFSQVSADPFKTDSEIENQFNHKLDIYKHYNKASQDTRDFRFTTFVLTHQDITSRNLILDRHGQVWLIDWAYAGAYPPAFERRSIERSAVLLISIQW